MAKKESKINFDGVAEIIGKADTQALAEETPNVLTDQEMTAVKDEVELEKKYGGSNARTFLEAGASAASFGISDQILEKWGGEEAKKGLRERRQRNEEAALAGEIAGVVAPAFASGGSSLAVKGAASGVKAAAKAGSFVERLSAKQLAKIIDQTGRKKIASQIISKSIPKATGSAVEGAFYGTGQLVSEDALGTAEFNAENLLASAGVGALLGGAAGGVIGVSEALIPVVKNNKVVDFVSKKINTNIDKRIAGAKLAKMNASEITKLKDTPWGQQVYDNIPDYYTKNLKLKVTDNTEKLFIKSQNELTRLGNEIGETALHIDRIAKHTPGILPQRSKIALKIQNSLKDLEEQFLKSPDELAKKSLKKVRQRMASWDEWALDSKALNATEIKELKTSLQRAAKWNRSIDQIPLDGKMDRQISEAVRQEFLDLADRVSPIDANIGDKLRKLNIDYGTGITITDKLKRAVDKEASTELVKFKDLLLADIATDMSGGLGVATGAVVAKKFIESDFKRKLILLTNLERANLKINKKITSGVKNFFTGAKTAAVPASTKILMSTTFSLPNENGTNSKKPKNKKDAFKQISEDLQELQLNPEKLVNHLSKNSLKLTGSAPNTAMAMGSTISAAVGFLNSKLPKDPSPGTGMFNRKYEPSSIEIAKFERYLQAVENPLSVVDDLESGSVTRESIEAIQAVYPDIYVRLQTQATEQIVKNPDLAYGKRLQIGILLDLPSDSSLLPDNITALQQTFTDEEQQKTAAIKDQGAVNTTQGGLQNIDMANSSKSASERVATRK